MSLLCVRRFAATSTAGPLKTLVLLGSCRRSEHSGCWALCHRLALLFPRWLATSGAEPLKHPRVRASAGHLPGMAASGCRLSFGILLRLRGQASEPRRAILLFVCLFLVFNFVPPVFSRACPALGRTCALFGWVLGGGFQLLPVVSNLFLPPERLLHCSASTFVFGRKRRVGGVKFRWAWPIHTNVLELYRIARGRSGQETDVKRLGSLLCLLVGHPLPRTFEASLVGLTARETRAACDVGLSSSKLAAGSACEDSSRIAPSARAFVE